jgi:RNA polymerase sigma-70 factor (ECF subfamily)
MGSLKSNEEQFSVWMRAANRGDQVAYRLCLSALLPVLRAVAARSLSRAGIGVADVEDLVQEIVLTIHLRRHTWDEDARFLPWMHGIARHKIIDALRRRGRRMEVPLDDFGDVFEAPAGRERLGEPDVGRFLGKLVDGQRKIVTAISVEGLSIREAAQRFGMSEGAARVTFHRGLKSLARLYRSES